MTKVRMILEMMRTGEDETSPPTTSQFVKLNSMLILFMTVFSSDTSQDAS